MRSYTCLHRYFVHPSTVAAVRCCCEKTDTVVCFGRTVRLLKHTVRGVPARQVTVLLPEALPNLLVAEIGTKQGSFDGAQRLQIALRPWSEEQNQWQDSRGVLHPLHDGMLSVRLTEEQTAVIEARWGLAETYYAEFQRLQSDLDQYELCRIVMWHWQRYYRFLPEGDARALADSFDAAHPELRTLTLAEANRLASRDLYRLARDLGWRKLTLREQKSHNLDGQWHRQEKVEQRRYEQGYSLTGTGHYSREAAAGDVPLHSTEVVTSYGVVVVE